MDLRRLRAGEWIAAASGAALLVSLFLPWYRAAGSGDATAWEALSAVDVVLAAIALAAVSLLGVAATQRVPAVPLALEALITLFGMVASVLVLVRLLALPGAADELAGGIWLGLAGAVGIVVGAGVAMRDERLSPPGRTTDVTGRPVPPPPEVPPTPLPKR
jgi:hypothetical protein